MAIPDDISKLEIVDLLNNIIEAGSSIGWVNIWITIFYIVLGFLLASICSSFAGKIFSKYTSKHYTQIIRRLVYYSILFATGFVVLYILQLDIKVLGIATLLTLGLGIASKTAVSNIISGLFLVFEKPFLVGDYLEFNGTRGELLSIDLLSIKIRTFDNTLVRIPNEQLLQNNFVNETRYPIRRLETKVRFKMNSDLEKIKKVLFEMAAKNPMCLESPPPFMLFEEFSETAIIFKFAVWVKRSEYLSFKNQIPIEIQKTLLENNFEMPVMEHKISYITESS